MGSLHEAIAGIANKFNVKSLNRFQMDAITTFVDGEEDIFINLPTGYGKSLIYHAVRTR
jgi:superfamily II DNA helicase RecQ